MVSTPVAYDSGPAAQHAHVRLLARLCRPLRRGTLLLEPRPSAASLERHAKKYGPEQVPETAAEYGLSVAIERPPRAARRVSGPSLKTRVAALVRDGHGAEAIAEIENLSPSRARQLVEEVS